MPPCLTIAFRWLAAEVKAGLNNIHDIASESHSLFTTYVTYCLQSRMKLNEQQQQQNGNQNRWIAERRKRSSADIILEG